MLVDYQLKDMAENGLIQPFNPGYVQPCSIDLTIGMELLREDRKGKWRDWDLSDSSYTLEPGEFVLAHTREVVSMPKGYVGDLVLRSSAARMGFDHCLSGLVDPGFVGQLTLELRNNMRRRALTIEYGMRLCQLTVSRLEIAPHVSYQDTGWYVGQMGATPSNERVRQHLTARRCDVNYRLIRERGGNVPAMEEVIDVADDE